MKEEILANEPTKDFLDLLDEDEIPNNSDAVLIASQYEAAIEKFRKTYYIRDAYIRETRWITQERPEDHYENIYEGSEDFDEDIMNENE